MLKLSLTNTYDVKDVPVKVGSYITGEHKECIAHMDFRIPAGFSRAMLHEQTKDAADVFYQGLIVGWREDVADEDGHPIPFNEENKAAILKLEPVQLGVMQALTPILLGVPHIKNSETGLTI